MTKPNGLRIAAVFPTDAAFQIRLLRSTACHGNLHQFADAFPIDYGKGIVGENTSAQVFDQKPLFGIVSGDTEGRLGQVIGSKREELGMTGDLVRSHPAMNASISSAVRGIERVRFSWPPAVTTTSSSMRTPIFSSGR